MICYKQFMILPHSSRFIVSMLANLKHHRDHPYCTVIWIGACNHEHFLHAGRFPCWAQVHQQRAAFDTGELPNGRWPSAGHQSAGVTFIWLLCAQAWALHTRTCLLTCWLAGQRPCASNLSRMSGDARALLRLKLESQHRTCAAVAQNVLLPCYSQMGVAI